MANVPFERHVFISYAHIDNQPLSAEQQGWVSRFHTSLDAMLSMRLGRKAEIWRDAKLSGNDVFADEIVAQFPRTAVLVSVLTPRYVESEWCTREVREFCATAERVSTLVVGNKSRIIKVIKTPVDSEDPLPPAIRQVLGYPFFTITDDTPVELDPAYGTEIAQKFNLKMAKLAWDIKEVLKKLEAAAERDAAAAPQSTALAIYLSECSYDRRDAREALEAELRVHGYTVLPDAELPRDEAAYTAAVRRCLARADLSVHLIGGLYAPVPDGPSQKSVAVLQNELAVAASRERGLRRIIWIPEGTEPRGSEQREFIRLLHTDAEAQFGADLITADLETVKAVMRATLQRLQRPQEAVRPSPGGTAKLIYLICDPRDRKATVPLRKVFRTAGCDVEIPPFTGDAADVRRANEELLAQCDAAVLFYGAGEEAWKRTVESDVKKAQAYRKERGPIVLFTYLAEPATDDKTELIDLDEPNLLNGLARAPDERLLQPLLDVIHDR